MTLLPASHHHRHRYHNIIVYRADLTNYSGALEKSKVNNSI